MSEQAIEFLEEWISEKVQKPQPAPAIPEPQLELEKKAEILVKRCQADAAKAGVTIDEIVEEVGDLEDLITAKLEDAEQAPASPLHRPTALLRSASIGFEVRMIMPSRSERTSKSKSWVANVLSILEFVLHSISNSCEFQTSAT